MIVYCNYDIVFVQFFTMFPIRFFYNKAFNWSIGFLQIVNISKLYHMLGSNHSTFYLWSFQVSVPYKFLVLKMQTLLFTKYMWKTITFHCLLSSRCKCQATSPQAHMHMRVFKMLIYYISSLWHLKTGVKNQNFELNFLR
jgi:hypothetical protein